MPRFRHIHTNFRGGEVAPEVWGQPDLEIYKNSAEEILNFIVKAKGSANYRPGSQFIKSQVVLYRPYHPSGLPAPSTLNGGLPVALTGKVRILPFVFNRDEAYAILVTRFGGETGFSIINVDTLAEAVITPFANTTWWSASRFISYNNDDEIDEIQIAQSGDIIFLCHANHPPFQLARTANDAFAARPWWVSPYLFTSGFGTSSINLYGERGVPYFVNLDLTNQMSAPATGGGLNQTVNSSIPYFTADMVGSVLKILSGSTTQYRFITAFNSSTDVTTQSGQAGAKGAITATSSWEQSEWSAKRGWPRAITLFEQRLCFGGNIAKPDTIWNSEIGDLFEFDSVGAVTDPGYSAVTASDPYSFSPVSEQINQIQWIAGSKVMNIGTLGREHTAKGINAAMSATDISVSSETGYGSSYRQPIRIENTIAFITKTSTKLREFVFNRDEDSFVAGDLTRFADHMPIKTLDLSLDQNMPKMNYIVKQENDETIVWFLDRNGGLYASTRDRLIDMNAFHYHVMGGSYQTKIPKVQSIASIPSFDSTHDDLWLAVTRTINGNDVTYIERMGREYVLNNVFNSSTSVLQKMIFSDSSIFYRPGGTFTVVPGLSHLEGQRVGVVADGHWLGYFTVASGQITIPTARTEAIVGLTYTGRIKTLNIENGSGIGTSQGAIKKFDQMLLRLVKTIGIKFGFISGRLDEVQFRPPSLPMSEPIPLFTGDKANLQMPMQYDREGRIVIEHDIPLPCRVSAISARGVVADV